MSGLHLAITGLENQFVQFLLYEALIGFIGWDALEMIRAPDNEQSHYDSHLSTSYSDTMAGPEVVQGFV